jgi:hypothetical protein
MRATLRDDALASHAGRFVWLELNYEDPRNAPFLETHPNQGSRSCSSSSRGAATAGTEGQIRKPLEALH